MNSKITIAIPNWNGCEDTLECLSSLTRLSYNNYEVVVVDNGSSDNSVVRIKAEFPDTHVIALEDNTGFTGACNTALDYADRSGARYIFFLNNDTVIDNEDLLSDMADHMDSQKSLGMLSPTVLYNNTNRIWFGGGDIERNTGLVKLWNQGAEYDHPDHTGLIECTFLAGCALFVRVELMKSVGGLYEPYFLTSEESELCIRISDMGYKLAVVRDIYMQHKVSQSMGESSPLLVYFMYRNKLIFIKRNAENIRLGDIYKISMYIARGLSSFAFRGKPAQAMSLLRGVVHFLTGVEGKGYYGNIL